MGWFSSGFWEILCEQGNTESRQSIMENLVMKWGDFSLDDREGGEVQLEENECSKNVTIAAKFLTKRALNTESVVRTFNPIWRPKNGFKVRRVGDHIILFIFDNEEEVEKILEGEPWSFDKHLVLIKRYDYSIPIQDVVFEQVSLWVQVHDIPTKYLSREVAKKLCEPVGVVNKEASLVEVDRGNIMRVRVKVDVTLPLCRGRVFKLGNGSKGWVSFKYERLPNICYWCGRLNHVDRDCDWWIQSSGTLTKDDQEFGSWLRASPLPAHNNSVFIVPGFYESKKKEIGLNRKQGGKTSTGNHGEASGRADTVEKGRGPVEEPLWGRTNVINAPVMAEDVMDVTLNEVATGDNMASIQTGKGAGISGDFFNEKIREIDADLEKFDLEKELTTDAGVNVETDSPKFGNTNICGIVTEEANQELVAWEFLNKTQQHVRVNEGCSNEVKHHMQMEKNKEQEKAFGVAVKAAATWKRIVRKDSTDLVVIPPLTALKRPGTELSNIELPKKKKQVSHDDQDNTTKLAGSDFQPCQKQ